MIISLPFFLLSLCRRADSLRPGEPYHNGAYESSVKNTPAPFGTGAHVAGPALPGLHGFQVRVGYRRPTPRLRAKAGLRAACLQKQNRRVVPASRLSFPRRRHRCPSLLRTGGVGGASLVSLPRGLVAASPAQPALNRRGWRVHRYTPTGRCIRSHSLNRLILPSRLVRSARTPATANWARSATRRASSTALSASSAAET